MNDSGLCANCGQSPLIEAILVRERIASGLTGYKHANGRWLCETCENSLAKLKMACNEAFGLQTYPEVWKDGRLIEGVENRR